MRRIPVAALVVVLALAVAPMAPATHFTRSCNAAGVAATATIGQTCALVLDCQGSLVPCLWDLTADVSGVGAVQGQIVELMPQRVLASCGPALLDCQAATLFSLPPTGVTNLECFVYGGERLPAVLTGLTCTATFAGHGV